MGSIDPYRHLALIGHAHALATGSGSRASSGGIGGILRSIAGTVGGLSHTLTGVFEGVGASGLAGSLTKALLGGFFHGLLVWVATGAGSLVGVLGKALSASSEPVVSGTAFGNEFEVMVVLSAAIALPLLAVGAVQAIVRQEPGTLLRSALVRLPLALLFTGVSVQLVALGLAATDQASAMVLRAAGDPTRRLLLGLVTELDRAGGIGLAAFGSFLVVLAGALVAFVLWLELAVRSAAIAAASLFLPLALAGVAWPATSHWARRLGETLAALVLSKLVIAAVLALAAGLLGDSSGVAGVVEGIALLAVAAFAPFALLKLVPAVEAGAAAHLEGLNRRPFQAAHRFTTGRPGGAGGAGDGSAVDLSGLGVGGAALGAGPYGPDRYVANRGSAGPADGSPAPSDPTEPPGSAGSPGSAGAAAPTESPPGAGSPGSAGAAAPTESPPGAGSPGSAGAAAPTEHAGSPGSRGAAAPTEPTPGAGSPGSAVEAVPTEPTPDAGSSAAVEAVGADASNRVPADAPEPSDSSFGASYARWAAELDEEDRNHG